MIIYHNLPYLFIYKNINIVKEHQLSSAYHAVCEIQRDADYSYIWRHV